MLQALSRYRILERIGEGGMGEVYKAEDPDLGRVVAIKVISGAQPTGSIQEARFLREARAAANFNHPNIASIFDLGKAEGKLFIVMEYVDGRNLRWLLREGPLKMDLLLHISHQICLALEEAHSRGVLHRDIKPENILIAPGNRVKLVDFGLAHWMESAGSVAKNKKDRITETGSAVGTPHYMSPEQLRGLELDARADIFSLGIVLYEMATGKLPFSGTTPMEIAASILKDPVMPPSIPALGLLTKFTLILDRCLDKDPARRFESAATLRRALDELRRELTAEGEMITRETATSRSAIPPPTPTLLVLPFETVGPPDDTSIATGLAHAIMTDLARVPGLCVLSKAAGAGQIATEREPRELARELRATLMLEGEVLRAGNTIAVMARLIDVDSGRVLWGSRYRGEAKDIFSMLDSVCQSVSDALPLQVSQQVRVQISRPATSNVNAFELYSRGRALLERHDVRENISSAIQLFEEAIRMDSGFALAHAALGEACWRKYENTHDSSWVKRSISSCDHALILDPGQARVHISLAITYFGTGKVEEAIEELNRALALQPESDDALEWLGRCYEQKGDRDRALASYQQAAILRPVGGHFLQLGACCVAFGLHDKAIENFRKVISLQPDSYTGYNNLGSIYYLIGQYEDAVDILRQAIQIHPNPESYSNLGSTYFCLGRYEDSANAFRTAISLEPANDVYHRNLGDASLRLGDTAAAQAEYQTACDLLRRILAVNPNDGAAHGRLALYLAKRGLQADALAEIDTALSIKPNESLITYLSSVVFAITGKTEQALAALRSALALGCSPHEARQDPDLASLHGLPEFEALVR